MLGYVEIDLIYLKKICILFQGKDKIDAIKTPRSVSHFWIFRKFHSLTPRSVSLRGVRLHAVLVCIESDSTKCKEADSSQC